MHLRNLFLRNLAQTSTAPLGIAIEKAEGNYLITQDGERLLDLIGGIGVANLGHGNKEVLRAIHEQVDKYLHVMVYGELIQSPQVQYASLLAEMLPKNLNVVYFTNSGAEAVEGALKLAKRVTGKAKIIAAHNSYHGSTNGALSLLGDEYWRNAFRPLLPEVYHFSHGSEVLLNAIDTHTAAVIIEPIQAEAGVKRPSDQWMIALRQRCSETNTLLIFDEIQTAFGRCGSLWAFNQFNVVPDVLLLGKALGGGMPLGAFISSSQHMNLLTNNPVLGHITTFGGHPVSCAAGMAALQFMQQNATISFVNEKGKLFKKLLENLPGVIAVRQEGLMIAIELKDAQAVSVTIARSIKLGLFSDWFLFAPHCIRIAPPLTITLEEIEKACSLLAAALLQSEQ